MGNCYTTIPKRKRKRNKEAVVWTKPQDTTPYKPSEYAQYIEKNKDPNDNKNQKNNVTIEKNNRSKRRNRIQWRRE